MGCRQPSVALHPPREQPGDLLAHGGIALLLFGAAACPADAAVCAADFARVVPASLDATESVRCVTPPLLAALGSAGAAAANLSESVAVEVSLSLNEQAFPAAASSPLRDSSEV